MAIHEDVLRELQWDTCVEEADVSIALNRQPDASDVELVAAIAHDLRQPLTIVRASAHLLRRRAQAAGTAPAAWLDRVFPSDVVGRYPRPWRCVIPCVVALSAQRPREGRRSPGRWRRGWAGSGREG